MDFYRKQGLSVEEYLPIVNEEITTHHIEDVLGDTNAWEYILSEEPTTGEKFLSFFKKAARDYSADEKLSSAARKMLREYKKMFAELSARNYGNNAIGLTAGSFTNSENMHDTQEKVFALSSENDDETRSVKQQMIDSIEKLSSKASVASIDIRKVNESNIKTLATETIEALPAVVHTKEVGAVITDKKRLKNGLRYIETADEYAAYQALVKVLKQGEVIFSKENHKDRGYSTITIAAPITFVDGGTEHRLNMAVVLRSEGKTYYKMHRIITESGENSRIIKNKSNVERSAATTSDVVVTTTSIASSNSISQNSPDVNTPTENNSDERLALPEIDISNPKITINSTDHERYLALKDRKLSLSAHTNTEKLDAVMKKFDITQETFDYSAYGDRSTLFRKIGEEFGVYKKYENSDVSIVFTFSKGNMKESIAKQRKNYYRFAKMLSCFDAVIENAIGIEVHNRNAENYKVDDTLKQCRVLASCFVDGRNIVPVKLEVKEFADKKNTLHIAIALESIDMGAIKIDEIVTQEVAENGVAQQYAPSSTISIADFFAKINPSDESFYKYIPKEFLRDADNKAPIADKDIRYAVDLNNAYSYESLTQKPDMTITEVTEELPQNADGKISRTRVRAMALSNVRRQNNPKNTADLVYAHCDDTGTDIRVGINGINHGLDRRVEVNAKASLVIGDLIKNAIKVNEVNSLSQGHEGDYVLLSCFSDETGVYGVSIYVDRVSNEVTGMDSIDIMYSVNGKKIGTAAPNARVSDQSPSLTVPTISISQLLEKSNRKFKDIFSKDVYDHFGTEKDTSTKLGSTTRYALSETEETTIEKSNTPQKEAVRADIIKKLGDRRFGAYDSWKIGIYKKIGNQHPYLRPLTKGSDNRALLSYLHNLRNMV